MATKALRGEATIAEAIDALDRIGLGNRADLRRIGEALIALAAAVEPLDGYLRVEELASEPSDGELAVAAKSIHRFRGERSRVFPADLFAEPAWDLLLDLFVSTVRGERVTTKTLCAAANVPVSTALRWIGILESKGLVRRWTPPDDQRLTTVRMTSQCYEGMRSLLAAWLRAERR